MNLSLLFKIAFLRKHWVIGTCLVAICGGMWTLIKSEPLYISGAKVWVREQSESSSLLKIQRNGPQMETHIKIQSEIIRSNRVIDGVLTRAELDKPIPSRSILTSLKAKMGKTSEPAPFDRFEALKALAGSIEIAIINPEVMIVSAKMNKPELAQTVVQAILDEYRSTSMDMNIGAIERHVEYLEKQRDAADDHIRLQEAKLTAFEEKNPEFAGSPAAIQSPTFANQTADVGPVPLIARQLAELKLKRITLASTLDESSFEVRSLDEEILQARRLLESYLETLSEQGKIQVQYDKLHWELELRRKSFAAINEELDNLNVSRGSRIAEQSGIAVLDPPSFDPERIHPKRKSVLIAAVVLGAFAGAGLALLIQLLDPKVRFPEVLEASTKAAVLANLPYERTKKTKKA